MDKNGDRLDIEGTEIGSKENNRLEGAIDIDKFIIERRC